MKIKYSLKEHFVRTIIFYLLALAIIPLLCSYSILLKTKPKATQRFAFFSELNYVDESSFKRKLFDVLPEDLQIDTYMSSPSDSLFTTSLSSYGLNSDICLLSKTTLDKLTSIEFLDLTNTTWDKESNYHFKDYSIGVLYKDNTQFIFPESDEQYYLLALRKSVHLNGLVDSGKTDQVNRVLEYLTSNG